MFELSKAEKLQPDGITPLTSSLIEPSLPSAISWLPNAPGWYVVYVFFALFITYRAYLVLKSYQHNAYRRKALKILESLTVNNADKRQLALLLRQTALHAYPRQDIAPLIAGEWEAWLDSHCIDSHFNSHHKGILATLAYSNNPIPNKEKMDSFSSAVAHWIRHHEVCND